MSSRQIAIVALYNAESKSHAINTIAKYNYRITELFNSVMMTHSVLQCTKWPIGSWKIDDYFTTYSVVFSHPPLPFPWYWIHHTHQITIEFSLFPMSFFSYDRVLHLTHRHHKNVLMLSSIMWTMNVHKCQHCVVPVWGVSRGHPGPSSEPSRQSLWSLHTSAAVIHAPLWHVNIVSGRQCPADVVAMVTAHQHHQQSAQSDMLVTLLHHKQLCQYVQSCLCRSCSIFWKPH